MKTLVILGQDAPLMRTRRWLLESEGYTAITISEPSELRHIAARVELLLLCHTATREDCNLALSIASERWPCMNKVILVANDDRIAQSIDAQSFSIFEGPAKLLELVGRLAKVSQGERVPRAAAEDHFGTNG